MTANGKFIKLFYIVEQFLPASAVGARSVEHRGQFLPLFFKDGEIFCRLDFSGGGGKFVKLCEDD